MTRAPLVLALMLAACASSDGFVDETSQQCAPGQPVFIQLGVDLSRASRLEGVDDQLTILAQVSNNSHEEITVVRVATDQAFDNTAYYRVEPQSRRFNQTIAGGEQHVFEIPTTGRLLARPQELRQSRPPVLGVRVRLANGDEYHCRYQIDDPS